jgi:predicted RNase H-like HicB family nuclease
MGSKFRYEVVIYWSEEDQAFIAEVPELPGCAADGATYQEAVANAEAAIQE